VAVKVAAQVHLRRARRMHPVRQDTHKSHTRARAHGALAGHHCLRHTAL
jgi:hypothetical protein